jgi:hypothetical protein
LLVDAQRSSREFSSTVSQRLVGVRMLRKLWDRGDLTDVIDYLCTIEESAKHDSLQLVVLADFLTRIELRGNGLCLDSCVRLIPLLDAILATSEQSRALHGSGTLKPASSHITEAALKALMSLVKAFGELIALNRSDSGGSSNRNTNNSNHNNNHFGSPGVDLNHEERVKKCDVCYTHLQRVRRRLQAMPTLGAAQSLLQAVRGFISATAHL